MSFMDEARARVRGRGLRIVYPEGLEERALRAAALLRDQDLARPILVGSAKPRCARARARARACRWTASRCAIPRDDPRREALRAGLPRAAAAQGRDRGARPASARPCRTTSRR